MDFAQFSIAKPELKDLRRPAFSQSTYVEVILIDASHGSHLQYVFQLNNPLACSVDQIDQLRQEIANLHRDAFTFLGEVKQLHTEKKLITLTSENIVTYKYLIIVASSGNTRDLNAFLPTLKDVLLLEALNAKAKIGENKNKGSSGQRGNRGAQNFTAVDERSNSNKISPLVQKCIAETDSPDANANQGMIPKRLCQIKS